MNFQTPQQRTATRLPLKNQLSFAIERKESNFRGEIQSDYRSVAQSPSHTFDGFD